MQMPMRPPPPQMVVPAPQPMYVNMGPPQLPPAFGMMPGPPQAAPMHEMMDEPPNKKARGEDNLMPEADFLAR